MSLKRLKIVWPDGNFVVLNLLENPLSDYYYRCITRLKNVELQFGPRENPLDHSYNENNFTKKLINNFKDLGVSVDSRKLKVQSYLNQLHDLYFNNFNKSKDHKKWLEIHDLIHLLEKNSNVRNCIWFDYRELAGPLIKKFDRKFLKYATTTIKKGYCYFSAHELGKDPYKYWQDGEPDNLKNICQLVKPWLFLRPLLDVAIKDSENKKNNNTNFLIWFKKFKNEWCEHWGLEDWQPWEPGAYIPIGYIPDIDYIIDRFARNDYPNKIINL
jgi:hypothetical protein